LDFCRFTSKQIEAARRAITRKVKRKGKLWVNVFPHIPVTSKPTEIRMGKGKGSLSYWCCSLKPGTLLFELDGVSIDIGKQALLLGSNKLSFRTKIIVNDTTIK
jgi:large subunit ribosomal protein L16